MTMILGIISILLVCMLLLLIFFKNRSTADIGGMTTNSKKHTIQQLNEHLHTIDKDSTMRKLFTEEVQEIKEQIKLTINNTIDGKISDKQLKKEYDQILLKIKETKLLYTKEMNRKNNLIKNINYEISSFKKYLETSVIYPKEFLFSANRLEGRVLDLKESKVEELPKLMDEVEKELEHFKNEIKHFYKLFNATRALLNSGIELSGNKKQEIYFLLQSGNFKDAEAILNEIAINQPITEDMKLDR